MNCFPAAFSEVSARVTQELCIVYRKHADQITGVELLSSRILLWTKHTFFCYFSALNGKVLNCSFIFLFGRVELLEGLKPAAMEGRFKPAGWMDQMQPNGLLFQFFGKCKWSTAHCWNLEIGENKRGGINVLIFITTFGKKRGCTFNNCVYLYEVFITTHWMNCEGFLLWSTVRCWMVFYVFFKTPESCLFIKAQTLIKAVNFLLKPVPPRSWQ